MHGKLKVGRKRAMMTTITRPARLLRVEPSLPRRPAAEGARS